MFVHPSNFGISHVDPACIQPNAIDVRIDRLFAINMDTQFVITDTGKPIHRPRIEMIPSPEHGLFALGKGVYQFETQHHIKVPEGYAGYLIPRSSLNRNGLFVMSGLYDSGFENSIGGTLYVMGNAVIERNSRIAQFVMVKAETAHLYNGQYNMTKENKNGN
jgi:deoxycytidine triphosphate deaminase